MINKRILISLISLAAFCWHPVSIAASCSHHVGQWIDPANGNTLPASRLFEELEDARMVLLGESHTTASHHHWQHYMLSALHARNSNMVVGFEMLPRRVQPALDAWTAGEIDEDEFIEQSDWNNVWGYDPDYYLPLLHFARQHRLPAIALNVDRELVSRVGQEGWAAQTKAQRLGLSDPVPASEAYRDSLAQLYAYKQLMHTEPSSDEPSPERLEAIKQEEAFNYFVEAQLTWDRAMAEALAMAYLADPKALVVGIVGRGHLEFGHGIPHQLAAMGIKKTEVLLPMDAGDTCEPLPADLARAVFGVESEVEVEPPRRARLGVMIEDHEGGGVRVVEVVEGSVAAATGIQAGDIISTAAGFETATTPLLIEVIQRQAAGTWLPLQILRGDRQVDLVARFPQVFE